jgi:hypothetical protein
LNFTGVKMDWVVALTGDEIDLQELSKVWNCPELTIEKDTTSYVLKSTSFDSLTSDQEIRERAGELLIPINAGIKLELGASKQIEIAHTRLINPDGSKIAYVMCYDVLSVRAFSGTEISKNGKKEIRNPADPIVTLFNIAQNDSQVAKICQYINLDLNSWFTLYNILEILEEDKFGPIMRGGHHKEKVDNFTETADNYRALGVKSRHAKEKTKNGIIELPKNPMSLSEAQNFIKLLIHEWLDTKKHNL